MSTLKAVRRKWEAEVDKEEIKLIEKGVSPYKARGRAIKIVNTLRKDNYDDKNGG